MACSYAYSMLCKPPALEAKSSNDIRALLPKGALERAGQAMDCSEYSQCLQSALLMLDAMICDASLLIRRLISYTGYKY